ncbi:hydrolase, partial [Bacillus toyonensis]|nr:hydrolase [Bacillus toyonensis]
DELDEYLAQWGAYGEEYRAIRDVEVVRIGSGHWPQFSVPGRLAELLVSAIDR